MNYRARNLFIILYSIFISISNMTISGQVKSIGLPLVQNYTTEESGAGTQSWDIIEDSLGNVYFGNNSGIVMFDGEDWTILPLMNGSSVRSLGLGSDGKVYAGGYTEIGVLKKDSIGQVKYESLNDLIPERYRSFDDVWKIYQTRYGIIFQSFEYLFIMNKGKIRVIEPESRFGFSYYVNNNFYITDKSRGLCKFENGSLNLVSSDPLFIEDEIRFILPHQSNDLLIGTFSSGLYILSNNQLSKWNVPMNDIAIENNIYNASRIETQYLFGTVKGGIYFTDYQGNILQHMNRPKGLQHNTVLSHYYDSRGNVWLGLNNGIDYLKTSLPISILNYTFDIEAVYSSIVFKDRLYVGTNQGLFTKKLSELSDPVRLEFEMVPNTEGQVWNLYESNGQLLCGHNRGAYRIEGKSSIKISESRGVWNFFKFQNRDDVLLSGSYDGIIVYKKGPGGLWREANKVEGFDISSRKAICDNENKIWISHDHKGLFRVTLNEELDKAINIEHYYDSAGISGNLPYKLHFLENQFFISTGDGNYTFDTENKQFKQDQNINNFFHELGKIDFLQMDNRGNRWYVADNMTGFFKLLEDGTYTNISTPLEQIENYMIDDYENMYIYDNENIFIGSEKGLVHYGPSINKNYFVPMNAHIKGIFISSKTSDSIWRHQGNKNMDIEKSKIKFSIPYDWNTIKFTFNCPDPENAENLEYSYRMNGYNEEWSPWNPENTKEYTNLRDGSYTFEVRAKNVYNNISASDLFTFSIEAPFYRSTTAYILYVIFFMGMLIIMLILLNRRMEKIRLHEKEKHTAVFQAKEEKLKEERLKAEREVEQLKIERLQTNMKHKNKELANSTYHIIRKNKFLNSLKQELSTLSKAAKSEFVEHELKKISRKIDRDINNEKNWEVFDRYFDEVHQEFLERLKEKHPDLSPKELRLSAYLRMNISTKEIAPLMNISVRGVEISRYRLRKKLDLDRDKNLTQYLMKI